MSRKIVVAGLILNLPDAVKICKTVDTRQEVFQQDYNIPGELRNEVVALWEVAEPFKNIEEFTSYKMEVDYEGHDVYSQLPELLITMFGFESFIDSEHVKMTSQDVVFFDKERYGKYRSEEISPMTLTVYKFNWSKLLKDLSFQQIGSSMHRLNFDYYCTLYSWKHYLYVESHDHTYWVKTPYENNSRLAFADLFSTQCTDSKELIIIGDKMIEKLEEGRTFTKSNKYSIDSKHDYHTYYQSMFYGKLVMVL